MCAECAADPEHWTADSDVAFTRALRMVFAAVLDRETAAVCIGYEPEAAVSLWPSSFYGLLAQAATRSRLVFCRCSCLVDARLADAVAAFEHAPSTEIVHHFVQGRDVLSTWDLIGLLWVLLRRRDSKLDSIIARLASELEVATVRHVAARAPQRRVPKAGSKARAVRLERAAHFVAARSEVHARPARLR